MGRLAVRHDPQGEAPIRITLRTDLAKPQVCHQIFSQLLHKQDVSQIIRSNRERCTAMVG